MPIGRAVSLERELIRDPSLPAVLAHELAHANSPDGQITLALSRFHVSAPAPDGRDPLWRGRGWSSSSWFFSASRSS
jgi:hypothetical protein